MQIVVGEVQQRQEQDGDGNTTFKRLRVFIALVTLYFLALLLYLQYNN